MMWIVRLALFRPYTFIVAAILILILGGLTIMKMSTDILPEINLPVVSVIWTYTGISPDEMEKRIVTISERAMTTTVNDIEHIESQSMNGVSVIKVFFQPNAKVESAVAQITSVSQTVLRVLPPGTTSPLIIRYNASSVPILQMGLSGKNLSEQQLYDLGLNFVRTQLATVQGAQVPLPYGGKARQVMVDLDPQALYALGLSATDVTNAINAQNLILPAGDVKLGGRDYNVRLNSSPQVLDELNNLPIKVVNGTTIYIKDVAHVRDGFAVQTNIVNLNGRRSTLLTILKASNASTLDIVNRVKQVLPRIKATLPPELQFTQLFDQSIFVRASIQGVLKEAVIASCLTAAMIMLFLGAWESTLIVIISIPLSILCSIIILSLFGETLNIMTLGGLALAIGMLVDDATVEIENIHRNMGQGKTMVEVILTGAQQVATPALVSTLSICIVFVPVLLLTGAAKSLFTPMAMAVVFAMIASYLLSRTLVPVLALYLIRDPEHVLNPEGEAAAHGKRPGPLVRFHAWFNTHFDRFRDYYRADLAWALDNRPAVLILFSLFFVVSFMLLPTIGQDFFPSVDAGEFRLHVRAPAGTRIEETEHDFKQVEAVIRQIIPSAELKTVIDNIGLPNSGINLAFGDNATIGSGDGEILVALDEHHHPTAAYVKRLRTLLIQKFPSLSFFFQPADIVSQILNFGLPSPIDIQIINRNQIASYPVAQKLLAQVRDIPGAVDVHLHQIINFPEIRVNVDRTLAQEVGLTQRDVANTLLYSLSSSGQAAPNYWLNPKNGVNYVVAIQTPQYRVNSMTALASTPVIGGTLMQPELLSNLSSFGRASTPAVINHYNVQPKFDIYMNVQSRDLGGVLADVNRIIHKMTPKLPRGTTVVVRGQAESMQSSFLSLGFGMIMAILLVYLLMVVNFQSWIDPLIIMTGTPAALSGILWMLFITQTTFSVPSLMGCIMCIGVATANSILVITFANEQRHEGKNAMEAALQAGFIRLRPVIMTAAAMIVGMIPMALGLGEGGEQNAPLGRAVIGGLFAATFATLFFVPILYSILRQKPPKELLAFEETHH